jgi:hypothetical protein
MHQLTLGWDFEHCRPVIWVDREFDFPTGEALWLDVPLSDPGLAIVGGLLAVLSVWALRRLAQPPRRHRDAAVAETAIHTTFSKLS